MSGVVWCGFCPVKRLLASGVSPDVTGIDGLTGLHQVCLLRLVIFLVPDSSRASTVAKGHYRQGPLYSQRHIHFITFSNPSTNLKPNPNACQIQLVRRVHTFILPSICHMDRFCLYVSRSILFSHRLSVCSHVHLFVMLCSLCLWLICVSEFHPTSVSYTYVASSL